MDAAKNIISLNKLMSKNKGKMIIVYFREIPREPCIKPPYINDLRKLYKNKDIIFINISSDKDVLVSKKAGYDFQLDRDHRHILVININLEVTKKYKIKTIPRYFLINGDGDIISGGHTSAK